MSRLLFSLRRWREFVVGRNCNRNFTTGNFVAVVVLGVLEYLDYPGIILACCVTNYRFPLFSYNGFTTQERCSSQGWRNKLPFARTYELLASRKAAVLAVHVLVKNERIYLAPGGRL